MSAVGLVIGFLPFITCIVFILGIFHRINRWNRAGTTRIPLFPLPSGIPGRWNRIAKEVLLFKGLLEGDRSLWIGTWVFHATLALILAGHAGMFASIPFAPGEAEVGKGEADSLGALAGGCAGLTVLGMGIYLLLRRLVLPRVRVISGFEDYASLILVLGVAVTGNVMRFSSHFELNQARDYFSALLSLRPVPAPLDPCFALHLFLGQILVMYIPFSKFLHIPGVFYAKSMLYRK